MVWLKSPDNAVHASRIVQDSMRNEERKDCGLEEDVYFPEVPFW